MIYQLGPCELDLYDLQALGAESYEWLVYFYETAPYEGNGEAIGKKGDKLYYWNLSHCSCYGPCDGKPTEYNIDDIFSPDIHTFPIQESILEAKVKELLGEVK